MEICASLQSFRLVLMRMHSPFQLQSRCAHRGTFTPGCLPLKTHPARALPACFSDATSDKSPRGAAVAVHGVLRCAKRRYAPLSTHLSSLLARKMSSIWPRISTSKIEAAAASIQQRLKGWETKGDAKHTRASSSCITDVCWNGSSYHICCTANP